MKKFTLFLVGLFIIFASYADSDQRGGSILEIGSWDNAYISVKIGNGYFSNPSSLVRIDRLNPGSYPIVVREKIRGRRDFRVIYRGHIDIPRNSKVIASITRRNNLVIREILPLRQRVHGDRHRRPWIDMTALRRSMRNTNFESDRKIIAEQAVSTHRVEAEHIYRIMTMFSFESTKLDFAKYAYRFCVDRQNYFRVNDAFTFSSSIRELNDYITGYRSDYHDDTWEDEDWDNEWDNDGNNGNNRRRGHR